MIAEAIIAQAIVGFPALCFFLKSPSRLPSRQEPSCLGRACYRAVLPSEALFSTRAMTQGGPSTIIIMGSRLFYGIFFNFDGVVRVLPLAVRASGRRWRGLRNVPPSPSPARGLTVAECPVSLCQGRPVARFPDLSPLFFFLAFVPPARTFFFPVLPPT